MLICCVARIPSQFGRLESRSATSGLSRSTSATACRPSPASPTTTRSSSLESTTLTASRNNDCSSASKTRITRFPSATALPALLERSLHGTCERNAGHAPRDVGRLRRTDHRAGGRAGDRGSVLPIGCGTTLRGPARLLRAHPDQIVAYGERGRLQPRMHLELGEDPLDVGAHGVGRDREPLGDVRACGAPRRAAEAPRSRVA